MTKSRIPYCISFLSIFVIVVPVAMASYGDTYELERKIRSLENNVLESREAQVDSALQKARSVLYQKSQCTAAIDERIRQHFLDMYKDLESFPAGLPPELRTSIRISKKEFSLSEIQNLIYLREQQIQKCNQNPSSTSNTTSDTCSANSYQDPLNPNGCICSKGFEPNATNSACVPSSPPTTCPGDWQLNANKTMCVPKRNSTSSLAPPTQTSPSRRTMTRSCKEGTSYLGSKCQCPKGYKVTQQGNFQICSK